MIAFSNKLSAMRLASSESPNIEVIWMQIFVGSKSLILGAFYRPPGSPESYLIELQNSIHSLPANSPVFICGDFNVPDVSWSTISPTSSDKNAALLCSMVHDLSLDQLVYYPTRGANI